MQLLENLESEGAKKKSKYWEITFKVVEIKFLAMHITNQKLIFNGTWSLLNILMMFGININNFNPYSVLLAIATNIPVLLMTDFVLQGHICN